MDNMDTAVRQEIAMIIYTAIKSIDTDGLTAKQYKQKVYDATFEAIESAENLSAKEKYAFYRAMDGKAETNVWDNLWN